MARLTNTFPKLLGGFLTFLLSSLAARTEQRDHPLLAVRPVEKTLLVLVTGDKGHLLALSRHEGTRILSARDFAALLR